MAPYILKIKYGDILRRVTVETSLLGNGPDMTFNQLEETIRQAFKIPATSDLVITYTDKDNDVVTMVGDHDLHDACVLQGLNPLRLTVVAQEPQRPAHHSRHGGRWGHGHGHGHNHQQNNPVLSDLMNILGSNVPKMSEDAAKQALGSMQQVLQACEPLIKEAPKTVVSEVLESIMKLVSSAAQSGAATGATPSQPGAAFSQPNVHGECPFGLAPMPVFPSLANFLPRLSPESPAPAPVAIISGDNEQAIPAASQDTKDPVQHRGVQCDVCSVLPIVGTRYKSNKKHDYDLCRVCFQECGRIEDYTKIERPLWRPRHFSRDLIGGRLRCPAFPSYYGGRPYISMRGPAMHGHNGPYGGKGESRCGGTFGGAGGKLDARFVQDVTIFDGTEFAPGTAFTKIWRLRNSGACAWPKTTQLVHVAGDELGSTLAISLELPEEGLVPDGEAEVSVDLVAPEKPGRYVSHWRLVSPTGQKFGHRVWVIIQVVPSDERSPQFMKSLMTSSQKDIKMSEQEVDSTSVTGMAQSTFTLQPMENDAVVQQLVDPFPAADVNFLEPVTASKESVVETVPEIRVHYPEISMEALTLDPVVIAAGQAQEENTAVESSEVGNFSMVDLPREQLVFSNRDDVPASTKTLVYTTEFNDTVAPQVVTVDDELPANSNKEEMMPAVEADSMNLVLEALESMGFKQIDLNRELLKNNDYDMQRTVDDLAMAAEWDPMLEELEEMGFYDTDMNRRLMFKNNGSVKRVVKELVQMYKDPNGKEQV